MGLFNKFPNITVVISCFFWGTYWIPLRLINSNGDNSVWPILLSFLIISILLIKIVLSSFVKAIIQKNYFFLIASFFSASGITLYSESLIRGEIAKVVIFFYLCPIWAIIFSNFLLNIKIDTKRLISISIAFIGIGIIIEIDKNLMFSISINDSIAILAGILWALGTTLFHKAKSTKGIEKTTITIFFIPFLFLLLYFIPNGRNILITDSIINFNDMHIWILLFAIIWILPSILLTYLSVEILDSGRLNLLLGFEVAVGFFSVGLLTDEIIGIREFLGALFLLSACFLDTLKMRASQN